MMLAHTPEKNVAWVGRIPASSSSFDRRVARRLHYTPAVEKKKTCPQGVGGVILRVLLLPCVSLVVRSSLREGL